MQWRRQVKVNRVIGSAKFALLFTRYQNAPPGEEDEEEGVRSNGYAGETQARESAGYQQQRNGGLPGPPWLKSRHGSAGSSASGNGNGSTTSGYASGGSRSRRGPDDPADSPTQQPKLVFNEEEYTRITTPRQDMLFKKGYLSQRKHWHAASTASMSATPSTTESQSASHSTADGSEAAEDQQLLDSGEYVAAAPLEVVAAAAQPQPQLGYGTYYDHASGYYYEYPMMLVGPAMPEPLGPNMLAAMPCTPVPLRPIEWVNPAFVPKLASQQYCYMDYQAARGADCATLVDAQGMPVPVVESLAVGAMNGLSNEVSLAGSASASASASASGSVADEPLALPVELLQPHMSREPMLEELPDPDQQELMLAAEQQEAMLAAEQHEAMLATEQHEAMLVLEQQEAMLALEQQEAMLAAEQQEAMLAAEQQEAMLAAEQQEAMLAVEQQEAMLAAEQQETMLAAEQQEAMLAAEQQEAMLAVEQQEAMMLTAEQQEAMMLAAEQQEAMMLAAEQQEAMMLAAEQQEAMMLAAEQQEAMLAAEEEEAQEQLMRPEDGLELEEGGLMEYPEPTIYLEALPAAEAAHQPLHMTHMMAQPMGQPYLYPGHYMFGPPVVNVNGVTMQSGPILRCSDMVASSAAAAAACAKRRKKKKKRKQKRPHALGNTEDDDEEDYSSEGESGLASSRVCWSVAATPAVTSFSSNRPLNPECQEFHLRPATSITADSATNVFGPLDVAAYYTSFSTPMNGGGLEDDYVDVGGEEGDYVDVGGEEDDYVDVGDEEDDEEGGEAGPLPNHHANHNEPSRLTDGEATESPDDNEEQWATGEGIDEADPLMTMSNGVLTNGDSTVMDESATNGATNLPIVLLFEKNESSSANGNLPRRKYSAKSLKFAREPTPGPDLDDSSVALVAASSEEPLIVFNAKETETDLEEVTAMIAASCIADKPAAQKDGDLDICRTWVNESSITSESCCNENNVITTTTTTKSLRTAPPTATDEDSGFESQSKLGSSSSRPITAAVTEWLKSVNSPDLFIMSSATSDDDDDEEDEDDASVCNEPSKNLQGNPMPALSVNAGAEDGCQDNRGEFAKPADRAGTRVCEDVEEMKIEPLRDASAKRPRKSRSAKRKATKNRQKNGQGLASRDNERENEQALARASTQNSAGQTDTPVDRMIEAICEFTGKDSDAGMRVAENSRITISSPKSTILITTTTTTTIKARKTERPLEGAGKSSEDARLRKVRDGSCKSIIDELQSVKTFEKGEIVVSMDGELLHVAAAEDRASVSSCCASEGGDSCGSTAPEEEEEQQEPSLGSIEEPDVLECWEAESLEPIVAPKKLGKTGELPEEVEALEHVQRYYRLQASVTSVEDEVCSELMCEENEKSPLSTPMSESTCSEEIVEVRLAVPEVRGKSCEQLDPRLPVDEAFEVYESYYTGRPTLPFGPGIDKSTRLLGRRRDEEGPIPCRVVCCNIQ